VTPPVSLVRPLLLIVLLVRVGMYYLLPTVILMKMTMMMGIMATMGMMGMGMVQGRERVR
jgi:hypothetical protein